ncbi:hypothetical protein ACOMHN_057826 [Nucella lapillus]
MLLLPHGLEQACQLIADGFATVLYTSAGMASGPRVFPVVICKMALLASSYEVINDEATARLPQLAINIKLDAQPSYEEVNKAIKQMTTGKAPGPDAIPAEVYKTGGETIRNQLTILFQSM